MSENQSEISEKELEQVSGGNDQNSSLEQLKMQDAFTKMSQATDMALSIVKKFNETKESIIHKIG